MIKERTRIAVVGASGYAGGEVVRLLAHHPAVQLAAVVSGTYANQPLSRALPGLHKTDAGRLICRDGDALAVADEADILILAQESGVAMRVAGELIARGKRIIDLSADFRLRDAGDYQHWYHATHQAPALLAQRGTVYGLVEWNRTDIKAANLVANPGCYPTATLLALLPLLSDGLINTQGIIVDAKSGVSGAGRAKPDQMYRYAEANESVMAYSVGGTHRHTGEIEQELSRSTGQTVTLSFTPHLVPMTRGLLSTCYMSLASDQTMTDTLIDALQAAYADAPFVVVRSADEQPTTKDVQGSNFCHLTARVDSRTNTAIVTSVIDNLVKGAAGQAIQNLNVMIGLPETTGLEGGGIWP